MNISLSHLYFFVPYINNRPTPNIHNAQVEERNKSVIRNWENNTMNIANR